MDVHDANRNGKPHIALVFGNVTLKNKVLTALSPFYMCSEYSNIVEATAGCRSSVPAVIVVGEEMRSGNGYDFVHMLRLDPVVAAVPVVMMVAKDDSRTRNAVAKCKADCHLANSCGQSVLVSTVSNLLNRSVESKWQTLPTLQKQALTGTLDLFNGLSNAIVNGESLQYGSVSDACKPLVDAVANNDFKGILRGVKHHDNYTYAHSVRVATLLALFGFNLHLSKEEQAILASGGLLHDVGKMSIPNEVLNKAGRLSPAEFAVMKGHVNASMAYLQGCQDLPNGILIIASQHHEKLDGTGYPNGFAGKKLDRLARMASIIDVFSALTDRRVYKPAMTPEAALKIMVDEMASHLDITLVGLFRQMLLDATSDDISAG